MPDFSYLHALRSAHDGDVEPLEAGRLLLRSTADLDVADTARLPIRGTGWTERETGLPPPDDWHGDRMIAWALACLAACVIASSALWWGMKAGWWLR